MERADLHLHTSNSMDSRADMGSMCASAVKQGLRCVCFTEHFSLNPRIPSCGHLDWNTYNADLARCRDAFHGVLSIDKGIELCEPHTDPAGYGAVARREGLDCILGAVHNADNLKLRFILRDYGVEKGFALYFSSLLEMVREADIDIVAHLDLIKRYRGEPFHSDDFERHQDVIGQILRTMIARGLCLEINASSLRKLGEPMPCKQILEHYRALGGERISFGSDAHTPEQVGSGLSEVQALAKSAGFTHSYSYKQRRPVPHAIE